MNAIEVQGLLRKTLREKPTAAGRRNLASDEVDRALPVRCRKLGEMPAVYCEIIKHAIAPRAASELTLFSQVYDSRRPWRWA